MLVNGNGESRKDLDIKSVKWIDEVLNLVLTSQPIPWEGEESADKISSKKICFSFKWYNINRHIYIW